MFAIGFITCMLLVPVLGKAVLSNETVCDMNEEFRRSNSDGLALNQKSLLRCHPRYGIMEDPYRRNHHVSGCFCKDNHYVDENNKCQPLKSCESEKIIDFDPKCDENEEYSTSKCSDRPHRCDYTSDGKEVPRFSNMCFSSGCYCKRGFFLDKNYKCVQPKDCPPHPENSNSYGGYGRKKRDINQENQFEIQNTTEIIQMDEGTTPKVNNSTEVRFTLKFNTDNIEKAYGCLEDSIEFVAQCMVKEDSVSDL